MWGRRSNRFKRAEASRDARVPMAGLRRIALGCASLAALATVAGFALSALDRPIQSVAIAGRFQRVSPLDVERVVKASVRGAGLVSVNLRAVAAAVARLPWVDTATIERNWPRGLTVRVVEQVPAARWDESGLINVRGELFTGDARHIPLELPRLAGPEGSESAVAQRYLAMQGRLTEAGMRLTALRLDARGAWQFDLDNGVTVRLGRKRVDERFETFMAVAAKIVAQRAGDIAYVDMRYANGFSIGWRGGSVARGAGGGWNFLASFTGSPQVTPRNVGRSP
ncbi:MAG TPA: cell division protein FtsQ/DivIB [Steroidobacteraceae bacterium]|nr:cell division protein FtsQ/DivIB [Steroidobacteraceae bacterium]